jgi:hypothetical protein
MPVRIVWEFSWKFHVAAPDAVSSVPVGADEKVFVTHTERPEFEIGSGVPNLHPTSVQSVPAGVEPDVVTPMLHDDPAHESVNRLVAPDGVALSGTCESPPPSESPPQPRSFSGIVAPTSRNEFPEVPVADVDVKSKPDGPPPGDVVDVDVDDEVLVLDDVLLVAPSDEVVLPNVIVVVVLGAIELLVLELVLDEVTGAVLDDVVLDGPAVVVVVDELGLHAAGSAPTTLGTDAAPAQSASKSATQSTHSTIDAASTIAPPQLDGGKSGATAGQLDAKPMSDGDVSPAPLHCRSRPPHARQMAACFFSSAFAICVAALPSPGIGHALACWPRIRASQHFSIALARFPR